MLKKGIYRHFKGGLYELVCEAVHTETDETLVVYRSVTEPEKVWARPSGMWTENVSRDGYSGPRFTYIGEKT